MNSMLNIEKDSISMPRANRKQITEFHKNTKEVRKKINHNIKQITITQIFDQVFFYGPRTYCFTNEMNEEMKTNIFELFQSVSNPSNTSKFS